LLKAFLHELRRRNVLRAGLLYVGAAWALAQGISELAPAIGLPEGAARWFILAASLGFPLWLAFAWFYELTPEGLRRESEVAPEASITRETGRRLDKWIVAVLSIALVLLLTDRLLRPDAAETGADGAIAGEAATPGAAPDADAAPAQVPSASIAVLPLANTSGDAGQDFFADGLTEELIAGLSRIQGLKVIGRSSSARFKASAESSDAIGRQLGVAHLLEGSVRRQGDAVRISVNLLAAQDGRSLWAQSFDRQLSDIFAVQGEIARAVATALRVQLVDPGRLLDEWPPSGNVEAYLTMLQARTKHRGSSTGELLEALPLMEQAIALDPNYAYAYAGLALNHLNLYSRTVDDPEAEARYRANALAAFERAHALAPTAPVVMLTHVHLLSSLMRDEDGALRVAQDALARYPDEPLALAAMYAQMSNRGRHEQALSFARKLVASDPMRPFFLSRLTFTLTSLGRYGDARQALRRLQSLEPQYPGINAALVELEILDGHPERAAGHAEREGDALARHSLMAQAHAAGGRREQALAEVAAVDRSCNGHCYALRADVHSLLGEETLMYDALEQALARAQADSYGLRLLDNVYLQRHWNDPRFRDLARRNGTPVPEDAGDGGRGNAIPLGAPGR